MRARTAFVLGTFLACGWSGSSAAAEAPIRILVHALRVNPGQVLYGVTVTNRTDCPLSRLTVRIPLPHGAVLGEVLTSPLGVRGVVDAQGVSWTLGNVDPRTVLGPFALRAAVDGEPAAVDVVVDVASFCQAPSRVVGRIPGVEEASAAAAVWPMKALSSDDIPALGYLHHTGLGNRYTRGGRSRFGAAGLHRRTRTGLDRGASRHHDNTGRHRARGAAATAGDADEPRARVLEQRARLRTEPHGSGVELDDGSLRDAMRYPRTFMLMLVSRQITEQSWLSQV